MLRDFVGLCTGPPRPLRLEGTRAHTHTRSMFPPLSNDGGWYGVTVPAHVPATLEVADERLHGKARRLDRLHVIGGGGGGGGGLALFYAFRRVNLG